MPTGADALDIQLIIVPNRLATQIGQTFQEWELLRNNWLVQKLEIRNYIFATDTTGTTNNTLPWKNSTHVPKLCQIRDNLHANYMAALFPTDEPITWEGDDETSDAKQKRLAIEAYMNNKMRMSKFRMEMSKCLLDFIDWGNCFGLTEFVNETYDDPATKEKIIGYVGPRVCRISPLDIVFNPTASSFESTPKIVRSLRTLGSIASDIDDHPEMGYMKEAFNEILEYRHKFQGMSIGDFIRNDGYLIDGFANYLQYFQSNYCEILEFYGDLYDPWEKKLYKNRIITVADRSRILRNVENPSWNGKPPIFHCGWRQRPDNLYAMGPLDNLVGMQYRIDHLENAKADGFDLIIQPVIKVKGFVEDFDYGPGERIFIGDEGDVEFMHPDATMLGADTQINMYEDKMEEMAGAPKQAMGFRTPGEKTAYEMQILENGANKIFINKTAYYEENFMEPILNSMLETARRNMGPSDLVRVMDDQFGVVNFMKVTREDLAAKGKIRPIGARHFARNANIVQNLTQFANSALGRDPAVNTHISGKKLAYLMEQLLGMEKFQLVQDNIRIYESLESQKILQSAQALAQQQAQQQGMQTPFNEPNTQNQNPMRGPPPVQGVPGMGPSQMLEHSNSGPLTR